MYIKTCEICGKTFESRYRKAKYCSRACGDAAEQNRKKARNRTAGDGVHCVCEACGKIFDPGEKARKFCSERCRQDIINERRRQARAGSQTGSQARRKKKRSFADVIKEIGSGSAYAERQKADTIEKYARLDIEAQIKAIKARG